MCASRCAGLADDLFRLSVLFETTKRGVEGVECDCNEEDELDGDNGKGSETEVVSYTGKRTARLMYGAL